MLLNWWASILDATLRIKGVSHDGVLLVAWNGSKADVYELSEQESVKRIAQFKCLSMAMVQKVFATWEAFHAALDRYAEDMHQHVRIRSTISVLHYAP
jgi:hypothetical protein